MKLYITPTSPYARLVRIVVLEKGLSDRVEVVTAKTRQEGSSYYAVNPSGRVPYLQRDDGPALTGSQLICEWLDQLDGAPRFGLPEGPARWEALRLQELALGLMDGLAVWGREFYRPPEDRSATVIAHERTRAERQLTHWEDEIGHPHMNAPLNMAQIMLATALDLDRRNPDFTWREAHPALKRWIARYDEHPSFVATRPSEPISLA